MNYDFIIYGGGISSQIAAIALANKNLTVCLIDDDTQSSKSNLVTFLSQGSVNYLASILTNPSFLNKYLDIENITCKLLNSSSASTLDFNDKENLQLGKIIPNQDIRRCLDENIKLIENITILKYKKILTKEEKISGVHVTLNDKTIIFAKVFILSSLKNEEISKNLSIKFIHHDLNQTALSMNVTGDFKKKNHAFQVFTPKGPLAFLPYLENEGSIVWSLKNSAKELELKNIEIEKNVNSYLFDELGTLKVKDLESHRLKFNFSRKLYDGNTILIGNTAHNIHPIAGQGLNLSIKDIHLFSETIIKYSSLGYEINNYLIFEEFDQHRKVDNASYSFGTLALDELLKSNNKLINMATNLGFNMLDKNRLLKNNIVKSATGKNFFKSY